MRRKKKSQTIRNKDASKNYTNSGNNKDTTVSDNNWSSSLSQKPTAATTTTTTKTEEGEAISGAFDSSKYKRGRELKESAATTAEIIHEQDTDDKEKTFSNVQRDELTNLEMVLNAKTLANNDNTNDPVDANFSTAIPEVIGEEKKEELTTIVAAAQQDKDIIKNQNNDGKKYSDYNNNINSNSCLTGSSMAVWQRSAMAWFDIYNELARSATKMMTEYWFNLFFWNPGSKGQKNSSISSNSSRK